MPLQLRRTLAAMKTAVADGDFEVLSCWCCGKPPAQGAVRLGGHSEVLICYSCLDWLNAKRRTQVKSLHRRYGRQLWRHLSRSSRC